MSRTVAMLGTLLLILGAVVSPASSASAGSAVAAVPASGVTCGKPGDQGLIVYLDIELGSATPEAGGVHSALVVYKPDGTQLHRVELDYLPVLQPLGIGCTAMAIDSDHAPLLLDAESGAIHPIAVPDGYDKNLYPALAWRRTYHERRWAFLSDSQVTHALLVDTQTGRSLDLPTLVRQLRGGKDDFFVALGLALSPDESSFLLMTDHETWLVPIADLTHARQLTDAETGRAWYSGDGSRIVYVADVAGGKTDVVVENVDGSGRSVVAAADAGAAAFWVPGSGDGQLLLLRGLVTGPLSVAVLSLGDRHERAIAVSPRGTVSRPFFSPSGRRVLLRTADDQIAWTWIDLDAGTGRTLDALTGYPAPYAPYVPGARWLSFFPSSSPEVQPGTSVLGLDLETGTVKTLLTFDFSQPYAGILPTTVFGASGDGRFVAVNDFGTGYPRFWLLDAERGTSTAYPGRVAGSLSPDGRSLIVSEPAGGADKRLWRTLIMTVDGRDVRTLAESAGLGGTWVPRPRAA